MFARAWIALFAILLIGAGCSSAPKGGNSEIYDPAADGEKQLADALQRAKKQRKRVLLDLGANWCSDSQATYRLLTTESDLKREIHEHYVLVMVDADQQGGVQRNQALLSRLDNPLSRGIPVLLILSPDGKVLNSDPKERLSDDAHTDPPRVLRYLQKWSGRF